MQALVTQADANIAEFAPYDPLPSCSSFLTAPSFCYPMNPGGSAVITSSTTSSYVYVTSPVNQTANQYQTTVEAQLNGNQTVFQQALICLRAIPSYRTPCNKPIAS